MCNSGYFSIVNKCRCGTLTRNEFKSYEVMILNSINSGFRKRATFNYGLFDHFTVNHSKNFDYKLHNNSDNCENAHTDTKTAVESADKIDSGRENERDVVADVEMALFHEETADAFRLAVQLHTGETVDLGAFGVHEGVEHVIGTVLRSLSKDVDEVERLKKFKR
jgi:hypothetical protein